MTSAILFLRSWGGFIESSKFDNLVRGAVKGASRRGVVRVGVCALAASALTTIGLRADDADAKKKKVCNCTSSDPATCLTQKMGKKAKNNLLSSNPCAYSGECQANVSGCPATCNGATPATCGDGCCPATFSKCCDAALNNYAPGTKTCNPPSYTCCPAEVGGGSCGPNNPTCCPPFRNSNNRSCATGSQKCCTVAQGGGFCATSETCCPPNPSNPNDPGQCCPAGQACCIGGGTPCPTGSICTGGPGESGCCLPEATERAPRGKRHGAERFYMVAQ